jgi:two-component system KDP operon response regulator KdpE
MMTTSKLPSILVLEEDIEYRRLFQVALGKSGFDIVLANTASEAIAHARLTVPDLIILDIDNPEEDGFAVLHQLRDCVKSPVIVLSALDGEQDIVRSLESGAVDHIVKPFRTGELIARLRVALRRRSEEEAPPVRFGELTVDLAARIVWNGSERVRLTPTEYALLLLFIQNAGKVLTHRYVLEQLWGPSCAEKTEYLRVFVEHLRKKIGDSPQNPTHVFTVPGIGYGWTMETDPVKPK